MPEAECTALLDPVDALLSNFPAVQLSDALAARLLQGSVWRWRKKPWNSLRKPVASAYIVSRMAVCSARRNCRRVAFSHRNV
jgi:hypothetical protein